MDNQEVVQINKALQQIKAELTSMRSDFDELKRLYERHKHEGEKNDGSMRIERSIDLLPQESLSVASVAALSGAEDNVTGRTVAALISGRDQNPADGVSNSQLILEHQYSTDGSTNQTFFYGIRAPLYSGTDASISSGGTTLKQGKYRWTPNSLAGSYVSVNNSTNSTHGGFLIASNTVNTLTISGGTWSFGGSDLSYTVFVPVYMGSASYPWRRLYTMDGIEGGIRFGLGRTAGGQNGLMYMDSNGRPLWRMPNGNIYAFDLEGD